MLVDPLTVTSTEESDAPVSTLTVPPVLEELPLDPVMAVVAALPESVVLFFCLTSLVVFFVVVTLFTEDGPLPLILLSIVGLVTQSQQGLLAILFELPPTATVIADVALPVLIVTPLPVLLLAVLFPVSAVAVKDIPTVVSFFCFTVQSLVKLTVIVLLELGPLPEISP